MISSAFEALDPFTIFQSFSSFKIIILEDFSLKDFILHTDSEDREGKIIAIIIGTCILIGLVLWDIYEGTEPWSRNGEKDGEPSNDSLDVEDSEEKTENPKP